MCRPIDAALQRISPGFIANAPPIASGPGRVEAGDERLASGPSSRTGMGRSMRQVRATIEAPSYRRCYDTSPRCLDTKPVLPSEECQIRFPQIRVLRIKRFGGGHHAPRPAAKPRHRPRHHAPTTRLGTTSAHAPRALGREGRGTRPALQPASARKKGDGLPDRRGPALGPRHLRSDGHRPACLGDGLRLRAA